MMAFREGKAEGYFRGSCGRERAASPGTLEKEKILPKLIATDLETSVYQRAPKDPPH